MIVIRKRAAVALCAMVLSLSLSCQTASAAGQNETKIGKTAWEVAAGQKGTDKFLKLVDEAGLKGLLEGKEGKITVFVPNDDAFGKANKDAMGKAKSDKAKLQGLVRHHVMMGSQLTLGSLSGRKASPSSGDGELLEIDGTGENPKIGGASFVSHDLQSDNGLVHVVDAVLMPPSLLSDDKDKKGMEPDSAPNKMMPLQEVEKAQPPSIAAAPPAPPKEAEKKSGGWFNKLFGTK